MALLLAAGHDIGAWARWRALFELAVIAEFIHLAPARAHIDNCPLTEEENSWRQQQDEIRQQDLLERFIRHRDIKAKKDADAEQRWLNAYGPAPPPNELMDEAERAAELAADLAKRDYAWAFPGSPKCFKPIYESLLAAIEADPRSVVSALRPSGFEPVETHRSRLIFWRLASQAAHVAEIRPRTIPILHSQVLEEAGTDVATLVTVTLMGAHDDTRTLLVLIGCITEPGRQLRQLALDALRVAVSADTCSNCGRAPRPDENSTDDWRVESDGAGELVTFCPECWQREFGRTR